MIESGERATAGPLPTLARGRVVGLNFSRPNKRRSVVVEGGLPMTKSRSGVVVVTVLALVMMAPVSLILADSELERATLVGLKGVEVVVEEVDPEAERDGLVKSTLQTEVELKLRQAGILVLSRTQAGSTPGNPWLYLRVSAVKGSGTLQRLYVFSVSLELNQIVRLDRNPSVITFARTWSARGFIGTVGAANLSSVRESVRDRVDEFINAYLAANPKR